jgi:hypothetical protein
MADERGCWMSPPPGIGPHLNDVGPKVEGPRGIAIAAVRGGGGGVAAHQGGDVAKGG